MSARNLLWIENDGRTFAGGKAHWPALLTVRISKARAFDLMMALSAQLRDHHCDPLTEDDATIDLFLGGGNLDPDES